MRKLFVNEIFNQTVRLSGNDHKHLSRVLRAKAGDDVVICDSSGNNFECTVELVAKDETILRVRTTKGTAAEPSISCRLFFGVLKGAANESTVRHAVEIGATRLTPFVSTFTVAKDVRTERLGKIALEASKQCGRSIVPALDSPLSFNDLAAALTQHDLVVFLYEKAQEDVKQFLRLRLSEGIKNVAVVIGSEGGFSNQEVDALLSMGITPLSMGTRILKADTAALTALACVMYESGNLN